MTRTKLLLLVPAAFALATSAAAPALASDGDQGPYLMQARPQVFQRTAPRVDLGSEAYPTTMGLGAANPADFTNHVLRDRVPAYQRGFDVGSEAYPEPR